MADAVRNNLPRIGSDPGKIDNPKPKIQNPCAASPSFRELLEARQGLAPKSGTPPQPAGSESDKLKFSAHASTRLASRGITLTDSQSARLNAAVQKAQSKGAKDSLVLLDDVALVVSVKNKTVVTVADKDNLKQNVFTNIDSAVIA